MILHILLAFAFVILGVQSYKIRKLNELIEHTNEVTYTSVIIISELSMALIDVAEDIKTDRVLKDKTIKKVKDVANRIKTD